MVVRVDFWYKDRVTATVGHFCRCTEEEAIEIWKQTMGNCSSTEQSEPPVTSLEPIAGVSNMQSIRYVRGGSHVARTISLVEPRHTTIIV